VTTGSVRSGSVHPVALEGSLDDLVVTLLMWSVDEVESEKVVHAAAQSVAAGETAEWVVALACLPPDAASNEIADVLDRVPPDLPFAVMPRGNPEAELAAAYAMVRRYVEGRVAERDLVRWMHSVIGHDRVDELELLVVLDDLYDDVEYSSDTTESVDAEVRAEAIRVAGLHPHL